MKIKMLITIAMIGAVFGVFFTFLDGFYQPLSAMLGPVFISITFGVYAMSAYLPSYAVRWPVAGLFGSLAGAVTNILTGSPYGIHIIVAGALQGIGVEAGFAIFKYKKYSIFNFLVSAIFVTLFVTARDYFVFGIGQMGFTMIVATVAVRIVSATVIPYLLCKAIGFGLQKANLMPQDYV